MSILLQHGSSGLKVKQIQKKLNEADYGLNEDGIYGDKTRAAVMDYQKNNGLTVDGIVGNETLSKLEGTSKPPASTSPVDPVATPSSAEGTKTPTFTDSGYQESDAVRQAKDMLQQQISAKPGEYQSQWQAQLDETLNKILNRENFSYDLNGDALYQQYKDQYALQGKQAMMDTMGQAAAMTGGYGNSYAQTAGQQAYQGHLQELNNIVPELYELALSQYNREGENLYNQYGMFADRENQDYSRYRDQTSDWQTELARMYDQYQDERNYDYSKYADNRDFDYGQYVDDRDYQYQQGRDQISDDQWQREFDEAKRRYDQEWEKANQKASGGSGGSGGSRSSKSNTEYTSSDVRKALAKAVSWEDAVRIADGMVSEGADADLVYEMLESSFLTKNVKPGGESKTPRRTGSKNIMYVAQ